MLLVPHTGARAAAKTWIAAVLSIFFHLLLILFLASVHVRRGTPVEVTTWDPDPVLELPKKKTEKAGVVVKSEVGGKKQAPHESSLLSDRNQTVEKQMRAKTGAPQAGGQGAPGPSSLTMRDLSVSKELTFAEKSPLFATDRPLEGLNGLESMTDEYLPDIGLGAHTILSTHEYAHWAYIQRIRQQLSPYWREDIRKKVNSLWLSGLKLVRDEYITKVQVLLNKRGELVEVGVKSTSGFQVVDLAAISAFRKASPFPNPPKKLIGADGTVLLAWTFVVKNSATEITIARPEEKARKRRTL